MNVAIVDVAAKSGGALSVLTDFVNYIEQSDDAKNHKWFIFTTIPLHVNGAHLVNIVCSSIKRSWLERLKWEHFTAYKLFREYSIDRIISLQNTGFFHTDIPQTVYFHNVLLLQDKGKYSLFDRAERKYAVYTRLIAPYTMKSLKKADCIITQTNVAKDRINAIINHNNIRVIRPNVSISDKTDHYCNRIKGIIYPAAAVPFKQFEELIDCVKANVEWFMENDFEVLITIKGDENEYAKRIFDKAKDVPPVRLIGYRSRNDILEIYKTHCLFVNSEMESYPLLYLEADYAGGAIISAGYDYAEDILSNYENVELYNPHDLEGMFNCIKNTFEKKYIKGPNSRLTEKNTWEEVEALLLSRQLNTK